ncbi:MAG: recombinase [Clostridiales bacterium GWF2_38_85]|nr:MAG: recombinase [Clostridiales bacterium GWF2_38_85]HBL84669.1 recombinase family protein [Clostridiales bacterium]
MAKTITVIPPNINPLTHLPSLINQKRKVAGYARVSTDSDEQFTSYEAQIDYYTNFIKSRTDWEYVKVYTDEGISALGTKHRDGFKKMIADALAGKIDLIVTKSVSRFARNTVDSLVTIRKLKEKGVECYFEKEGIYTFDGKGELLLTIMSSLAQEESRSISENVTWGQRKRFADGKVSVGYSNFLGFEKGENDTLKVVPEQAETVRIIYKLFLEGKTTQGIANYLMEHGILSPSGKQIWQASTVASILTNEKYKGDALLQKRFTVDFLTKELRINNGEVPQYYVEGSHEAIITPEEFELVQDEMTRRKELGRAYSDKAFHSKLICGDCGGFYGRKVWHSSDEYRSVIFQCNNKFKNTVKCTTPRLTEDEIKQRFLTAYNELMGNRENVIADCELIKQTLCDTVELDNRIKQCEDELTVIMNLMQVHIKKNTEIAQSQIEYAKETERIENRYKEEHKKFETLCDDKTIRKRKSKELKVFIGTLRHKPLVLSEWDERIWITLLDTATVMMDGSIVFRFKSGGEITA